MNLPNLEQLFANFVTYIIFFNLNLNFYEKINKLI